MKTKILRRIVHYHCPFEVDILVNLAQVLDRHALNDRAVISVEPATDVPVDVDIVEDGISVVLQTGREDYNLPVATDVAKEVPQ